jgi:hypothetical protein
LFKYYYFTFFSSGFPFTLILLSKTFGEVKNKMSETSTSTVFHHHRFVVVENSGEIRECVCEECGEVLYFFE